MRAYLSYFIKGMAIGIANAIPGVSGGTIAFVLGIYEKLTYSISSLPMSLIKLRWKDVAESLKILIPVFLGAIISIFLFLNIISFLFANYPIPTKIFFVGLVLGSFPFVTKTVEKYDLKIFLSFFLGAFIMAIFVYFDINEPEINKTIGESTYSDFSVVYGIKLFFCGIAAAIAMVIPGISGSLLLLILGEYENISYFVSNITSNFNYIYPLIFLGVGIVIGIFAISKLITILIQKYRGIVFGFVLGILIVSFLSLWPNITFLSVPMLAATVLSMCLGFLVAIVMEKI
ncbi:DUF368 domain-containing protein [Brachyspira catarrhinii]|uniref:DUF368 domain-containing protein n=1 Tax=Brachyspira catarrhinii TaxID=2528966 RepID=A0ABY2TTI9_9SPIR|nr:DUF368 domain-containing protein [Brachyspira catarrhinii]TKZ35768.1 DUF368 domain-containing protein [Brachyspira catarrhinii]